MPGRRLVEREIGAGAGSVVLDGLQEEKTYLLTFSPAGPRVPQDIGQVSTFLPCDIQICTARSNLLLKVHNWAVLNKHP